MSDDGTRMLFLLRHAKSSWDQPVGDHDRPLSERGRRDAAAAGRLLAERGWWPDLVLCSTALRTRQTWELAEAAGAGAGEVRFTERVYEAAADELATLLSEVVDPIRSVLLIGHGPGLPELADRLSGGLIPGPYKTSGLAVLRFIGPWSDLGPGELIAYETPRG